MHSYLHWYIHTCIDVSVPELLHLLLLACPYPCSHVSIPSLVVLFSFEDSILAIMFLSKLSCLQPCIDAFIPALIILSLMSCFCLNNKSSIPGTTLVFKIWCFHLYPYPSISDSRLLSMLWWFHICLNLCNNAFIPVPMLLLMRWYFFPSCQAPIPALTLPYLMSYFSTMLHFHH